MPRTPQRRHGLFRPPAAPLRKQRWLSFIPVRLQRNFYPTPVRNTAWEAVNQGCWRCAITAARFDRADQDWALPFTDPRLEQVYLYWRGKAAGRTMPSRGDIDPIEIPKLLPDVMLVERHENGRYRYRLIGTENTRAHGMNATGRFLDEVLPGPDYAAHVLGLYDECVRERRPLYSECLFFPPGRQEPERHTKVLFMPLSPNGECINMVFVIQVFLYIDRATRERHFVDARPYQEIVHILL